MPIEYDDDYIQPRNPEYEKQSQEPQELLSELARIRRQNAERQRRWRLKQKGIQKLCPHCGYSL